LSILSRKVLQSVVASGTSNPQLGGELDLITSLISYFMCHVFGQKGEKFERKNNQQNTPLPQIINSFHRRKDVR
jgi:hypothetical protein